MASAMVQSEMMPSRSGPQPAGPPGPAQHLPGGLPHLEDGACRRSTATTEGSWSRMPLPRTATSTEVVPKSMAISRAKAPCTCLSISTLPFLRFVSCQKYSPSREAFPRNMGEASRFFKGFWAGYGRRPRPPLPGARLAQGASRLIQGGGAGGEDVVQEENPLPGHLGRVGALCRPRPRWPPLAALGQGGLGRGVPRFLQQGNGLGGKGPGGLLGQQLRAWS